MPEIHEGELTPAETDPEREDERIEEVREEAEQERESFVARNRETAAEVSRSISSIEAATFNSDALNEMRSEPVRPENTVVADPNPDPRLDRLEKLLADTMTRLDKTPRADKDSNTRRYLARFLGIAIIGAITATAVGLICEFLSRKAHDEPTDDLQHIPPETQQQISDLVNKWKAETDEKYWEDLAQYVESNKPTAADQILFCNYTIQFCPSPDPWFWDSGADEIEIVDALEKLYDEGDPKSTTVLYRNITKQTYQGEPLPRDVAASVLRLALAQIFQVPLTAPV